ncbi:MAG: NERD domain-containing protein [Gammaproteobacteria bacterium]|nr:NERD domain-containing protein [Gammaproteobacteria bacterium]
MLKRFLADHHIRAHIKKLGNKTLSNIRVPDGVDGELFIEHLVLNGDKIIVVDVKRYDGLIYAGEQLDTWTQVVNRRNFQFANPLLQMKNYIIAVQSLVPNLDVEGAVLFAGRSYFPKRVPDGVLTLDDIPKQPPKKTVSEHALSNWQKLQTYQQRGN